MFDGYGPRFTGLIGSKSLVHGFKYEVSRRGCSNVDNIDPLPFRFYSPGIDGWIPGGIIPAPVKVASHLAFQLGDGSALSEKLRKKHRLVKHPR